MATPAQILANRENALHSTGPVTSEGKSRSAQNATKHGLTSKSVVLPNESEEEYDEFRDSLVADLEPVGDREITLATVIAETSSAAPAVIPSRNSVHDRPHEGDLGSESRNHRRR